MQWSEPYAPRPIRPLGTERLGDSRVKLYGIAYGRERPRGELVEAARAVAAERLPEPAVTGTRYGVGFVGAHDGRGGNFVFVDWWEQENELHHHVWFSTSVSPGVLRPATDDEPDRMRLGPRGPSVTSATRGSDTSSPTRAGPISTPTWRTGSTS